MGLNKDSALRNSIVLETNEALFEKKSCKQLLTRWNSLERHSTKLIVYKHDKLERDKPR